MKLSIKKIIDECDPIGLLPYTPVQITLDFQLECGKAILIL